MQKTRHIGGDKNDQFWRYKTYPISIKITGTGNGIKTEFTNIFSIAEDLARPAELLIYYFAINMNTSHSIDENKKIATVNGAKTIYECDKILDHFIKKYVVCPECKNPETKMIPLPEGISLICKACGANSIIKNPNIKMHKMILETKITTTDNDYYVDNIKGVFDENYEFSVDTSPEAVRKRVMEEHFDNSNSFMDVQVEKKEENVPTPQSVLIQILEQFKKEDPNQVMYYAIKEIRKKFAFSKKHIIDLIGETRLCKNIRANIDIYFPILKHYTKTSKDKSTLVSYIRLACKNNPDEYKNVSYVLMKLYITNVLDESDITDFHEHISDKKTEPFKMFYAAMKPIIQYFKDPLNLGMPINANTKLNNNKDK